MTPYGRFQPDHTRPIESPRRITAPTTRRRRHPPPRREHGAVVIFVGSRSFARLISSHAATAPVKFFCRVDAEMTPLYDRIFGATSGVFFMRSASRAPLHVASPAHTSMYALYTTVSTSPTAFASSNASRAAFAFPHLPAALTNALYANLSGVASASSRLNRTPARHPPILGASAHVNHRAVQIIPTLEIVSRGVEQSRVRQRRVHASLRGARRKNPLCDPRARQPFPATRAFVLDVSPSWTVRHPPHHLPRRAPRDAARTASSTSLASPPPRVVARLRLGVRVLVPLARRPIASPTTVSPRRVLIHPCAVFPSSASVRRRDVDVSALAAVSPSASRPRNLPDVPRAVRRRRRRRRVVLSIGNDRARSRSRSRARRARAARDEGDFVGGRAETPPAAARRHRASLSRARRPNADDVDDDDDDVVENAVARRARARRRGARERVDVTSNASRQTTPRAPRAPRARDARARETREELERDARASLARRERSRARRHSRSR